MSSNTENEKDYNTLAKSENPLSDFVIIDENTFVKFFIFVKLMILETKILSGLP